MKIENEFMTGVVGALRSLALSWIILALVVFVSAYLVLAIKLHDFLISPIFLIFTLALLNMGSGLGMVYFPAIAIIYYMLSIDRGIKNPWWMYAIAGFITVLDVISLIIIFPGNKSPDA